MQMIADESGTLHPAVELHDRIPIEVHLPKAPPRKAIGDPDMREQADLWCYVWRSKTNAPVEYVVRQVRLFVNLKRTLTIPQPALDRVDPRHHTKSARHDLDNVVESAERLAEDAFRLWVRALRWKSLNAHINQMLIEPMDVSHGSYLANRDTRKSFYSPPRIIDVGGRHP